MSRNKRSFRCSSCNEIFDRGRFELWDEQGDETSVKVCVRCSNSIKKYECTCVKEYIEMSKPKEKNV